MHCIIGEDRKKLLDHIYSNLNQDGIFITRTHCGDPPANAPLEIMKTWDPKSRCQIHDGIAGRYFGLPEDILLELKTSYLNPIQHKVFNYPNGWAILEIIAKRKE